MFPSQIGLKPVDTNKTYALDLGCAVLFLTYFLFSHFAKKVFGISLEYYTAIFFVIYDCVN